MPAMNTHSRMTDDVAAVLGELIEHDAVIRVTVTQASLFDSDAKFLRPIASETYDILQLAGFLKPMGLRTKGKETRYIQTAEAEAVYGRWKAQHDRAEAMRDYESRTNLATRLWTMYRVGGRADLFNRWVQAVADRREAEDRLIQLSA